MRTTATIAALGCSLLVLAGCKQETNYPVVDTATTAVVEVPVAAPPTTSTTVVVPVPGPTSTEVVRVPVPGPTVTATPSPSASPQ